MSRAATIATESRAHHAARQTTDHDAIRHFADVDQRTALDKLGRATAGTILGSVWAVRAEYRRQYVGGRRCTIDGGAARDE